MGYSTYDTYVAYANRKLKQYLDYYVIATETIK